MATAPQFGIKFSNQEELANFRHAPFAKANLNLVTVSEEQATANLAAEAERKAANKATRKAEEAAAKQRQAAERLTQNVSLVGCITALPDEQGLKLVKSFMVRKSGTPRPTAVAIPADVLASGLADDRLREEERQNEERAQSEEEVAYKERVRVGYIQDVVSTALGHLRREDINLEAKVLLLNGAGFTYECDHQNGRDGIYVHAKSTAWVSVTGGAISTSQGFTPRSNKNMNEEQRRAAERRQQKHGNRMVAALEQGSESTQFKESVLTAEEREEQRQKNIANAAARKAAKDAKQAGFRAARKPTPKAPKADKNKKDGKKSKKGGERQ